MEPRTKSKEPGARSQETEARSKEPGAKSQELVARSKEPGARSARHCGIVKCGGTCKQQALFTNSANLV